MSLPRGIFPLYSSIAQLLFCISLIPRQGGSGHGTVERNYHRHEVGLGGGDEGGSGDEGRRAGEGWRVLDPLHRRLWSSEARRIIYAFLMGAREPSIPRGCGMPVRLVLLAQND
jgi:hypothetical protein